MLWGKVELWDCAEEWLMRVRVGWECSCSATWLSTRAGIASVAEAAVESWDYRRYYYYYYLYLVAFACIRMQPTAKLLGSPDPSSFLFHLKLIGADRDLHTSGGVQLSWLAVMLWMVLVATYTQGCLWRMLPPSFAATIRASVFCLIFA